jgi:hypothetical protein
MLAIVIIYNIWGFYLSMTPCNPLQAYWDFSIHGDCRPVSYMWAEIGLHIGTDFLIFMIPIPVVLIMKVPLKQKMSLFFIFALGFLYVYSHPLLSHHAGLTKFQCLLHFCP